MTTTTQTAGFSLIAPNAEQREAFAALQAEMRRMQTIFAGPATTPDKLDGLAADCESAIERLRKLKIVSIRASYRRRAGR